MLLLGLPNKSIHHGLALHFYFKLIKLRRADLLLFFKLMQLTRMMVMMMMMLVLATTRFVNPYPAAHPFWKNNSKSHWRSSSNLLKLWRMRTSMRLKTPRISMPKSSWSRRLCQIQLRPHQDHHKRQRPSVR